MALIASLGYSGVWQYVNCAVSGGIGEPKTLEKHTVAPLYRVRKACSLNREQCARPSITRVHKQLKLIEQTQNLLRKVLGVGSLEATQETDIREGWTQVYKMRKRRDASGPSQAVQI